MEQIKVENNLSTNNLLPEHKNGIISKGNHLTGETVELEINQFFNALNSKHIYSLEEKFDSLKITSLNLSNCGLSDIPSALKVLPLKDFNLSKNCLAEIPQCFYLGLEQLEILDISQNEIGKFEYEPNCCKTLRKLLLCRNKLKNIPQWILCLRGINLEELHYDFNKVTYLRCIFDNSMKFPVRKLSMRNCILRNEDCRFLKECKNLDELDLSNCMESTHFMNLIPNVDQLFIQPSWKNISILKLNNLSISLFPEGLLWLETLRELYLSYNEFLWLPTNGLEFLVNLEVLDISHNSISTIPDKLTWLEHVKILNFSYNNIETIPDFSKMESLETLDLYHNKLSSFNYKMDKTKLKCIDLELNHFDTEEYDDVHYKDMRDNLRKAIYEKYERFSGFRDLEEYDPSESDSFSSESSFDDEDVNEEPKSYVSEDWDEEIRLSARNALVTESDDEWKGFEEDVIFSRTKEEVPVEAAITYSEDVIFCDAD